MEGLEGLEGLGERLRNLRLQRELTMDMVVYDVSNTYHVEFTKGNLSRWENGVNYPSLLYAAYLAKYYNVSLDYLIGNTEVKTPVGLLTHKPSVNKNAGKQKRIFTNSDTARYRGPLPEDYESFH